MPGGFAPPSRPNYPPTETDTLKGWHGLQRLTLLKATRPCRSRRKTMARLIPHPREDGYVTAMPRSWRRQTLTAARAGGADPPCRGFAPSLRTKLPHRTQRQSVRVRKDDAAHTHTQLRETPPIRAETVETTCKAFALGHFQKDRTQRPVVCAIILRPGRPCGGVTPVVTMTTRSRTRSLAWGIKERLRQWSPEL